MGRMDCLYDVCGNNLMALTLEAEQRLSDVDLIAFYEDDSVVWFDTVRQTRNFVKNNFPNGALIRRDDVAKALLPILEVHEGLKQHRNEKKLRAKYWIKDFADLLIDRTWDQLQEDENGQVQGER
jgi:hypothetical protein